MYKRNNNNNTNNNNDIKKKSNVNDNIIEAIIASTITKCQRKSINNPNCAYEVSTTLFRSDQQTTLIRIIETGKQQQKESKEIDGKCTIISANLRQLKKHSRSRGHEWRRLQDNGDDLWLHNSPYGV
uniref:Uncharacterized protein n=1 Tax=Glossina austeni TaxID=7395 RepID=A0A1A9UY14_GLOAU